MTILMSINFKYVVLCTSDNYNLYSSKLSLLCHANNTRTTNNSFIHRHLDRLKVWVKFTTSLQVVYNV